MSLVNSASASAGTVNLPIGSGTDRYVVAFVTENHWDFAGHATTATLNGVGGTSFALSGGNPDGIKAQAWYWLDVNLPASGTYAITLDGNDGNGRQLSALYLEDMIQQAPVDVTQLALDARGDFSDTLVADAGSCVVALTMWNSGGGTTVTVEAWQTVLNNALQGNGHHTHTYTETNLSILHDFSAFETSAAISFAIEPNAGGGGGSSIPVILNHHLRH